MDISTCYTKEQNKKCGRYGYCMALREKETVISPKNYGMFLLSKKYKKEGKQKWKKQLVLLIDQKGIVYHVDAGVSSDETHKQVVKILGE